MVVSNLVLVSQPLLILSLDRSKLDRWEFLMSGKLQWPILIEGWVIAVMGAAFMTFPSCLGLKFRFQLIWFLINVLLLFLSRAAHLVIHRSSSSPNPAAVLQTLLVSMLSISRSSLPVTTWSRGKLISLKYTLAPGRGYQSWLIRLVTRSCENLRWSRNDGVCLALFDDCREPVCA